MAGRSSGVLILSHGRPGRVKTVRTLLRQGYTGPWWIVCDDEDDTLDEYRERYHGRVITFSKAAYEATTDVMDADRHDHRGLVYARNAAWDVAAGLGLTHFVELDDDYVAFERRYEEDDHLRTSNDMCLDATFSAYWDFLDDSGALTVCMAQGGDFVGGMHSTTLRKRVLRKAMNVFFLRVDRRFSFSGRLNEDVAAYVALGQRGGLFLTACDREVHQTITQRVPGGLTELYKGTGTYIKTFYAVMAAPSCVRVSEQFSEYGHPRIHHEVISRAAYPLILGEEWRKC